MNKHRFHGNSIPLKRLEIENRFWYIAPAKEEWKKVSTFSTNDVMHRDVAQMVERLVWDQEAAGSSPVIPTIRLSLYLIER